MKNKILSMLVVGAALVLSACGQKNDTAQIELIENDVELAPLQEKKLEPLEEAVPAKAEPDSVGNMAVYPSGYGEYGCLYGTNTITFYFEEENVEPAGGIVYVYESPSGSNVTSISTDSADNVTVSAMDDAGRAYTGWESGTKIDVAFSEEFEMGKNYYVLLEPSCFKRGTYLSKSISNASLITFRVKDYGFESFNSALSNDDMSFSMNIMLGGDATGAEVVCLAKTFESGDGDISSEDSGDVSAFEDSTRLSESGVFTYDLSEVSDCAAIFAVKYYDEGGKNIDSSTFVVTKGSPLYEEVESMKVSVFGESAASSLSDELMEDVDAEYAETGEGGMGGSVEWVDGVIVDELSDITSYSEEETSSGYKLTFDSDKKSLKSLIKEGSIVVMPANDEFLGGTCLKVESVSVSGNRYVLTGTAPELEEVFKSMNFSGSGELVMGKIEAAEGASVTVE